jgi:hypothetical protein
LASRTVEKTKLEGFEHAAFAFARLELVFEPHACDWALNACGVQLPGMDKMFVA